VSQFAPEKLAAIACHKSQSHKAYLQPDYIDLRSSWWAAASGISDSYDAGSDVRVEAFRIARCSIFGSSALAFTQPASSVAHAESADRARSDYTLLRRVV